MSNEHEEYQYLNLVKECIEKGVYKQNRTGIGTYGFFGRMMRYSLKDYTLPLLTTKTTAYRVILEELLFFIKGKTDNKLLKQKKINIWTGNSTKEFYEKYNINREEDDLGPVYGFQWNHFNAPYVNCKTDYTGKGVNQLQNAIDIIKKDPTSRRMVIVAWNPEQLREMALPPCHCLFQFYVADNKLSCLLYQRSGDMGLGVPFNIASYSLLALMVAKVTGLEPGEFIHSLGDVHLYENHIEPIKKQLERTPYPFPKIKFKKEKYDSIYDFEFDDFILENYESHPTIKMDMAV
ncbi:Thymidylate synthase [Spraguea lophii 42_110]|uniref:thymidylate synthase n=1 Tax=Spraguea lophii (strain 42_110) TaxID=1358809 RepID=S7WAT9_SPRLO|nr:Thymidylate synthase [Spraguea lophii 42_110]